MNANRKNVKISNIHHKMLKEYSDKKGLKIYKILEKWIEQYCLIKKDTLYDE